MVLGSGDFDETGWKPGLLIFGSSIFPYRMAVVWYGRCLGEVDAVIRGQKEIKSQLRTILETINTLYSI